MQFCIELATNALDQINNKKTWPPHAHLHFQFVDFVSFENVLKAKSNYGN